MAAEKQTNKTQAEATLPEAPATDGGKSDTLSPIIALCASAGGIEALQEFFCHMPGDSGLVFVVAVHLGAGQPTSLPDLLQQKTLMPVSLIEDGVKVAANCVYVIPPDQEVGLLHGTFQLLQPVALPDHPLVMDTFLQALADEQGARAICIILSGAGTDGTQGLRAIKEKGGLVIVQDPETAQQAGMPRSAINTGLVDYILPVAHLPDTLLDYVQRAAYRAMVAAAEVAPLPADGLSKIFMLLRAQTGHDFSRYKQTSLNRRVGRRLAVTGIENVATYVNYLRHYPDEVNRLFKELLVSVTHFFRDPEAFAVLQEKALPDLFTSRPPDQPIRVWVPGCATGEEAYSLAILLHRQKKVLRSGVEIQIFATDLDGEAIDHARQGVYPASIIQDVTTDDLQRFFLKEDHSYAIRKEIREMVTFAQRNIAKDPPFSRLDLISCRNLLIYLETDLQKHVLALFHYALKPDGFLFLGPSESLGDFSSYFITLDRKWRLFQRTEEEFSRWPGVGYFAPADVENQPPGVHQPKPEFNNREFVERTLLAHYDPAAAIVNEMHNILYSYGPIDRYLKLVPGEMSRNILDLVRPGLELDLMTAVRHAVNHKETVRRQAVPVKTNGGEQVLDLTVKPILQPPAQASLFLVIFEPSRSPQAVKAETELLASGERPVDERDPYVLTLERELSATRQHLQTALEEMQVAYEELKSKNEEMQSANEELQSSNEELKTSKEELQSVNEELTSMNLDYHSKNEALTKANNDLHNLLRATRIATVFLDSWLHIRGFTPSTTAIINLISSDIGRPLKYTVSNLRYQNLVVDAEQVLDTLAVVEREVQTEDGRWYNMRILPYRTVENVIDGLVVTFTEVTEQKQTKARLRQALAFSENVVDTVHEALLVLDDELHVVSANRSFYQKFGVLPAETEGRLVYELGNRQWDIAELHRLLEEIMPQNTSIEAYEMEHEFAHMGRRLMRLNAHMMPANEDGRWLILLAIDDVTTE